MVTKNTVRSPIPFYAGRERRRWVRVPASHRARGQLAAAAARLLVARVVNVSVIGARFLVGHPPEVGDRAELTLDLGDAGALRKAVRVVCVCPLPAGVYAVGVAFRTRLGLKQLGRVL